MIRFTFSISLQGQSWKIAVRSCEVYIFTATHLQTQQKPRNSLNHLQKNTSYARPQTLQARLSTHSKVQKGSLGLDQIKYGTTNLAAVNLWHQPPTYILLYVPYRKAGCPAPCKSGRCPSMNCVVYMAQIICSLKPSCQKTSWATLNQQR